jgi:aminomethyltransferase
MLKRTPLFSAHQNLGARLVDFAGWEMPLHYAGIVEEHLAVRTAAGIFDISHMGEITVGGAAAREFLNAVLTNDVRRLEPGGGQYTLSCNPHGGVIDDLYVFQLSAEVYLLIVNASRTPADVAWLQSQAAAFGRGPNLTLTDASHNYAAVAIQGPAVPRFINDCIPGAACSGLRVSRVTDLAKNQIAGFPFEHANVLVSRTGYTGEDGFEVVGRDESIQALWDAVLAAGKPFGIKPCGLGARDTLRTEVCYPLYGHELDETTTPIEAGLGRFVALDKGAFVGRAALAEQQLNGVGKKCVAFRMAPKSAPPRPHYPIRIGGARAGEVTSGTQSPSLGIGIGLGYVPADRSKPGTAIEIEIRGRETPAVIVPKPIYSRTV